MARFRRAWRQIRARSSGAPSPLIGIAIVIAATAVVLAAGWVLAALTALAY